MEFGVHVVDSDGDPVEGTQVTVYFTEDDLLSNVFKGYTTVDDYTDEDGRVEFETAFDHHDNIIIYCQGERHGPYDLVDGGDYTVTV